MPLPDINETRFYPPRDPLFCTVDDLKTLSCESPLRRCLEDYDQLRSILQCYGHQHFNSLLTNYSTAQMVRQDQPNNSLFSTRDAFSVLSPLMSPLLTNHQSDVCNAHLRSLQNGFLCTSPKIENSANLSGSTSRFCSTLSQTNPNETGCVKKYQDNSLNDTEVSKIRPQDCSSSSAIEAEEIYQIETQKTRELNTPRHPLNAYNFFFSDERVRILNGPMPVNKNSQLDIDYQRHCDNSYMKTKLDHYLKQRLLKKSKKRVHRKSHGKISFKDLASLVANRWKKISPEKRSYYNKLAELDRLNYDVALSKCKRQQSIKGKNFKRF